MRRSALRRFSGIATPDESCALPTFELWRREYRIGPPRTQCRGRGVAPGVPDMRIGIDASNLREGGGVTHLVHLLAAAEPAEHGVSRVVVWSSRNTLDQIASRPWLDREHQPLLDGRLPQREYWRARVLPRLAAGKCDLVFTPGGGYPGRFLPCVTMFQNALPFDSAESRRYGVSWQGLRNAMLRVVQTRGLVSASGVIFLTHFSRDLLLRSTGDLPGATCVIPHGVDQRFALAPRLQRPIGAYSTDRPFRFLYVSKVDVYKHQWAVAEAVAMVRSRTIPIALDLVGPAYAPALQRLSRALRRVDASGEIVRYHGAVPFQDLPPYYHAADALVFASTCETLSNILVEAMAAGLPIVCLRRGPMPEVLGEAAVFFDDERPATIAAALAAFALDVDARRRCSVMAYQRAQAYSWARCARETFAFLAQMASAVPRGLAGHPASANPDRGDES